MAAAVTEQISLNASSSVRLSVARIAIATWHEEAFDLTIQTVRDLSAGVLRRDPAARMPRRQAKPEPVIVTRRGTTVRTRWQYILTKRAALTGKTVEQLREEERLRGAVRRQKAKEAMKHE